MADEEKKADPELDQLRKEIEALRNKNRELLDEKKSTKSGAERQLADAQDRIEELTASLETSKRESDKARKLLEAERDDLKTKYTESSRSAQDFERGVVLREALSKQGIGKRAAEDVGDAIAHIERMVQYGDDGKPVVKYKDDTGKEIVSPLSEYAEKVYPGTAHAKRFIVDGNTGAGASGTRTQSTGKTMSLSAFAQMAPKDQSGFMAEGGTLTS